MSESTSGQTMTGRTVLVTGASDGIGAETAKALAGRGATVHVTGRSAEKLRPVADAVGTEPLVADFSRLDDVRRLAEQVGDVTHDGDEPNFQVNHLAPFLLTNLLRPRLAAAGSSLVVNTSSIGNLMGKVVLDDLDHERRRALEFPAYGTGKLMNIVFTRGISQRWSGDGIVSVAVHPGPVGSSFGRDSWLVGLLYRSPLKRLATISVPDGAAPLSHAGRARAGPGPGRSLLQPLQPEGPREQAGPRPDDHRRPVGTVGGAGRTDHMTGSRSHDVGSCHTRLWLRGVKGYAD